MSGVSDRSVVLLLSPDDLLFWSAGSMIRQHAQEDEAHMALATHDALDETLQRRFHEERWEGETLERRRSRQQREIRRTVEAT